MAVSVQCECGQVYDLKDEFVGRRVQCPDCGAVSTVEPAAVAGDPAFDRDKFLLRQKALAIQEKYYVWDEEGRTILYVERPRHVFRNLVALLAGLVAAGVVVTLAVMASGALGSGGASGPVVVGGVVAGFATLFLVAIPLSVKRHVTVYRDDTRGERLLEVLQDRKFQPIVATYTVRDAEGQVLALLAKNYLYNVVRKRWRCRAPSGATICIAKEDSIILSLLRRLLGPLLGVLRTNFIIVRGETDQVIGVFNRKYTLLDRYLLDLTRDRGRRLDRRIALALGVMLDTGERR